MNVKGLRLLFHLRHRPFGRPVIMALWRTKIKPPVGLVVANLVRHYEIDWLKKLSNKAAVMQIQPPYH